MTGTVHVIGAGLAGLSAAVRLAEAGRAVILYEAARQAGGRCRSYRDATLDLEIDNGNHLLLSGNRSALDYAALIGGSGALTIADEAAFDFAEPASGLRWRLRPNAGRLPWWLLVAGRRVPDTGPGDYFGPLRLFRAGAGDRIGDLMRCDGLLYDRLWNPVLVAALNTEVPDASARLAATILRETLGAGGRACRPVVATGGLSAAFVDPALAYVAARGGSVRSGTRVRALERVDGRVTALRVSDGDVPLGPEDAVVLAVPAPVASDLVPGLQGPTEHRSIVNAHFRLTPPDDLPLLTGLVGTLSEWLFRYPDRLSVTISAADRMLDDDRDDLARRIWAEVAAVAGIDGPMPRWQIVKEKRATFAAMPEQDARRPEAGAAGGNVILAGDWTQTGLPSTIEGAIRSGENAAQVLLRGDIGVSRSMSKASP